MRLVTAALYPATNDPNDRGARRRGARRWGARPAPRDRLGVRRCAPQPPRRRAPLHPPRRRADLPVSVAEIQTMP